MTKVSFCVIMFAMMAAEYLNAQSFYHVYVEPNKAEREVIPIEPGPLTAELILQPKDYSWKIRNSGIVAPDDDFLWSGPHGYMPGTQPTPYMHMYLLLNGHSSREYVKIEGNLMKPGNGVGNSPWFRVTVPDVDIDWDGYEDKEDEEEEDARKVYCPVENDISKCKKLILRNPLDSGNIRDDSSLLALYKNVVLSWTPAAAFQVKDSSGNAYSNGGSISLTTSLTWPLELYVVPVSGQPLSDIVITLEGPAGADGTRAKDRIIGSSMVSIQTQTFVTQPVDRSRKTIGVGELVKLSLPLGINSANWSVSSGNGTVVYTGNPTVFTAPERLSTTTVTATYLGGSCSVVFNIIEPNGMFFENAYGPGGVCPPAQYYISVSYGANVYVQPDTVNFNRIRIYEGAAKSVNQGYFMNYFAPNHESNGPHYMTSNVYIGKGTQLSLSQGDMISGVVSSSPYIDGTATWNLDWEFDANGGSKKNIETVNQVFKLTVNMMETQFKITKDTSGAMISTIDSTPRFIQ